MIIGKACCVTSANGQIDMKGTLVNPNNYNDASFYLNNTESVGAVVVFIVHFLNRISI